MRNYLAVSLSMTSVMHLGVSSSNISPMDGQCVSLLPGVCEVLAGRGRVLPDDTSLEKLLDWFTGFTKAGGSLLDACPCLLDFISAVVHNTSSDPSVLSFALKLAGLLAASEEGFQRLQESSLLDPVFSFQRWQEAGLWEDPCFRIGWIHGLKNLLQHPKALMFSVKSDVTEPLLQLQTDASLFVASAANQMLAHILVFFQSVSSAECNGVDKKGDGRNHSSIHTDVVVAVSEYLKRSLVPKDNTKLHQSVQTLKLLALLLAQVGPPLQDMLFRTAADSLEELVTAGYSQLTLPLMDVIIAAHSSDVPDQRAARLLSSMFSTKRPCDLIQAAASFLQQGRRDAVHTAKAVRILLLPLDLFTGQTLLDYKVCAEDDQRLSMVEQLKSKTSCISVICVCLINTPQFTLMPSDVLPCSPDDIVTAVLSVLKLCSGMSTSAGAGELCRNIMHCGRVQKCALEALTALSSSPGAKQKIVDVLTVLIHYLDNPDSGPTVLHKSYQALVKWMRVCADVSSETQQLRHDLVAVVRKRVCDVRWEVRDSTLEFVGQVAGEGDASHALLEGCCTTALLREALQDTESYVRASAISALAKTLAHSWQQGAAPSQEESEIVTRLLEILSQDTEGFPRRAVVRYFIAWLSSGSSHTSSSSPLMRCLCSILSHGSADLDWEVKVYTLELAELLIGKAFSGHCGYRRSSAPYNGVPRPYGVVPHQTYALHTHSVAHGDDVKPDLVAALGELVEQGVVSALLCGLVDCDRPVGLKACQLLITLRETLCPPSQGTAAAAGVSCELPDLGWGLEIRRILGMMRRDDAKEADRAEQEGGANDFIELKEREVVHVGAVGVCEVLMSLGLDERLETLTQSSDHVHNSPLSLLQDILTGSSTHSQPDTQLEEEVIVDCY